MDWEFQEIPGTEDEYNQPISGVRLLKAPYEGIVFSYHTVQVVESPTQDAAILKFKYTIHEPKDLHKIVSDDPHFIHFIGDILRMMIEETQNVGGEIVAPQDELEEN